jgi:hypothetical protein
MGGLATVLQPDRLLLKGNDTGFLVSPPEGDLVSFPSSKQAMSPATRDENAVGVGLRGSQSPVDSTWRMKRSRTPSTDCGLRGFFMMQRVSIDSIATVMTEARMQYR